jgi:hypothetical protein
MFETLVVSQQLTHPAANGFQFYRDSLRHSHSIARIAIYDLQRTVLLHLILKGGIHPLWILNISDFTQFSLVAPTIACLWLYDRSHLGNQDQVPTAISKRSINLGQIRKRSERVAKMRFRGGEGVTFRRSRYNFSLNTSSTVVLKQ